MDVVIVAVDLPFEGEARTLSSVNASSWSSAICITISFWLIFYYPAIPQQPPHAPMYIEGDPVPGTLHDLLVIVSTQPYMAGWAATNPSGIS